MSNGDPPTPFWFVVMFILALLLADISSNLASLKAEVRNTCQQSSSPLTTTERED